MAEMMSRPPFVGRIDQAQRLAELSAVAGTALTANELAATAKVYEAAIAHDGDDWRLHFNYAELLIAMGNGVAAEQHARRVRAVLPDSNSLDLMMANVQFFKGNVKEAIGLYRSALAAKPNSPQVRRNLASALVAQREFDEAIVHASYLLKSHDDPGARNTIGLALMGKGDLAVALAEFNKILALGEDGEAHANIARICLAQHNVSDAIGHYRKACNLAPGNAKAHNNLAAILMEEGYLNEAIERLETALQADPNYALAHGTLGQALARRGDADGAILHLRKSIELGNRGPVVLITLSRILATHPDASKRQGGEAIKLAEEAVKATGGKRAYDLEALAAAYAETGRFDEAIKTIEDALKLVRGTPLERRLAAEASAYRVRKRPG